MKKVSKPNKTERGVASLARDYFMESFERFPVWGGQVGVARLQGEMGRHTPETFREHVRSTRRALERLEEAPLHELGPDAALDRLAFRSRLRLDLLRYGELETWRANPQQYLDDVSEGLYGLVVRRADDLRPVAKALVSRIRQIPKYLDEAAGCVRLPIELWARLAVRSAPGTVDLIESLADPLTAATSEEPRRVRRWTRAAAEAVTRYADRIARKKTRPNREFALGRERFERMIRDRLGMDLTAREAVAAAEGLSARLATEMRAEARRFHPRRPAHEILDDARNEWAAAEGDLLTAYRRETAAMKAAFKRAGAMSFPKGERLLVNPVPEFMARQFPTAAYSSPGALESDQTGIFWVNDLSLKTKTQEARQGEVAQHFGLELTSAHEAYPGHHLQFTTQNRHPSFTRRLSEHSIYYEGWTLWCEQMAVDLKVSKNPYLKLIQLHDALWRANRIIIDCGLQTGEMSYDAACRRLMREVGFTRARAEADVNWYTSSPTVPMSYLLGKMELMRLKDQRVGRGGWTLKRFNDWVLSFGAIPWSWIEASGL